MVAHYQIGNKVRNALLETYAKLQHSADLLAQANQQIDDSRKRILASKAAIEISDEIIEDFRATLESEIWNSFHNSRSSMSV